MNQELVKSTPNADATFEVVKSFSLCKYAATPKSLNICAIETNIAVIEKIPISLGNSSLARMMLTPICTAVAPFVEAKVINSELRRLAMYC